MRFDQLHIPAFGPFTDFRLDLSDRKGGDFHVIYGANEGGKSSLLRAIDQALFGIPARSTDNFLHSHPNLRIGATVSSAERGQLQFLRKKGNANTLLDPQGNSIDEQSLKAFLGPVDQGFFQSMFGLDTAALRDGARALISGDGELGSALFSASLGNTDIDAAIERLEAEAHALFKGRSRVKITNAITAYKESEKAARDAMVKATAWKAHQKELEQARATFEATDEVQASSQRRLRELQRYQSAQPLIAQLADSQERYDALAEVPDLPSDFPVRVRATQEKLRETAQGILAQNTQIASLQQQSQAIATRPDVLLQAAEIEALHQQLSSYLAAAHDLPLTQQKCQTAEAEIDDLLEAAQIDCDQLAKLPVITRALIENVTDLEHRIGEQTRAAEAAQKTLTRLESDLEKIDGDLENTDSPESPAELKKLHSQASLALSHREKIAGMQVQLADLHASAHLAKKRLELGEMSADEIAALRPPSAAAIHEAKADFAALETQRLEALRELDALDRRLANERASLAAISAKVAVHTRADLDQQRSQRDESLRIALDAWGKGEAADRERIESLPRDVQLADDIADSLHENAEQIAIAQQHDSVIHQLEGQRPVLAQTLERIDSEIAAWQKAWEQRCRDISAPTQSPADLIDWIGQLEGLCDELSQIAKLEREKTVLERDIAAATTTLSAALDDAHIDLEGAILAIDERLSRLNHAAGAREALIAQKRKIEETLRATRAEMETAREAIAPLESSLAPLISPFPAPPAQLQIVQEKWQSLAAAQAARDDQKSLITAFASRVEQLKTELLPDSDATDIVAIEKAIWALLAEAKSADTQHKLLADSLAKLRADNAESAAAEQVQQAELQGLKTHAKAESGADLETVLSTLEQKVSLGNAIAETRQTLAGMTAGVGIDDFIAQASALDGAELERDIRELEGTADGQQTARDEARKRLDDVLGIDAQLQRASDEAAHQRQRTQLYLAEMVDDAQRFIDLQHAIHFLRAQIAQYREKTQGPMIESTSDYFADITSGAFARVAAQLDDKNVPHLVGVRGDGSFVPTTGMSEGTADQLYLALRLAAIDLHLASHSPMPLILDDLLITFDDDRTRALLPRLAELSKKTQVLIFTHHEHLLELFTETLPNAHTQHRI